jgi:Abortive infection alpha
MFAIRQLSRQAAALAAVGWRWGRRRPFAGGPAARGGRRIRCAGIIRSGPISEPQDESREELAELWARLLANAMDPNLNNVRHSFIEAVKKMDPMDAVVLQYVYVNQIASVRYGDLKPGTSTVGTLNISQSIGKREDEAQVLIRHLEALSFFDMQPSGGWLANAINREFMRACYPEPAKA